MHSQQRPTHTEHGGRDPEQVLSYNKIQCHVYEHMTEKECIAKKLSQMPCTPHTEKHPVCCFQHILLLALFIPLHILLLFLFFYHIYALVVLLLYYFYFYSFALSTERPDFTSDYTLYNFFMWQIKENLNLEPWRGKHMARQKKSLSLPLKVV